MLSLLSSLFRLLIASAPANASKSTPIATPKAVQSHAGAASIDDGTSVALSSPLSEGEIRVMNFKELIDTISQETAIPAGQVRKVSTALLEKFSNLIEKQENFRSPIININAVTIPAKEASGDQPIRPERKIAKMLIVPQKPSA